MFVDGVVVAVVVVVLVVEVFALVVEVVPGCKLPLLVFGACDNVTRNPTLGRVAPERENRESMSELRSRVMLCRQALEFPPFSRLENGS